MLDAAAGGGLTLTAGSEPLALDATAVSTALEAPFLQLVLERLWRETPAQTTRTRSRSARLESLGGARLGLSRTTSSTHSAGSRPAEQNAASAPLRFLVTRK